MSLSAQVAALEAELARKDALLAPLRLRLEPSDAELAEVELMVRHRLTRGESAVLTALLAARPRSLDRYSLDAAVPARDHARDRDVRIVDVLICRLRKKLGPGVIETTPGWGWRIDPKWKGPVAD
jgi:DNA-binding response OmpR family regulator